MYRIISCILLICLALSGCAASIGQSLTTSDVRQFKVGVTPKQDVLKGLGTPDLTQIEADNNETWTYIFGTRQVATLVEFVPAAALLPGFSVRGQTEQRLELGFSSRGTLASCRLTSKEMEVHTTGAGGILAGNGLTDESQKVQEQLCG